MDNHPWQTDRFGQLFRAIAQREEDIRNGSSTSIFRSLTSLTEFHVHGDDDTASLAYGPSEFSLFEDFAKIPSVHSMSGTDKWIAPRHSALPSSTKCSSGLESLALVRSFNEPQNLVPLLYQCDKVKSFSMEIIGYFMSFDHLIGILIQATGFSLQSLEITGLAGNPYGGNCSGRPRGDTLRGFKTLKEARLPCHLFAWSPANETGLSGDIDWSKLWDKADSGTYAQRLRKVLPGTLERLDVDGPLTLNTIEHLLEGLASTVTTTHPSLQNIVFNPNLVSTSDLSRTSTLRIKEQLNQVGVSLIVNRT